MRGPCLAAAAGLSLLGELSLAQSRDTLFTVAQRDRMRSNASPAPVSISADGRFIAFSSYEPLSPEDDDRQADIYVLDRRTGAVTLESADVGKAVLAADCTYPRISGDGRYIVFETSVPASGNEVVFAEVILRDRQTRVTKRITRTGTGPAPDGWSGAASVSDDGAFVVFESSATNLVPGPDANGRRPDVYLAETATGQVHRISLDVASRQSATGASLSPSMSADGRYVAFMSSAPLTEGAVAAAGTRSAPSGRYWIYIRDTQANTTTRINATAAGAAPNESCLRPAISRDGAYVAFVSTATNLASSDRNRASDVFLHDRRANTTTLVSRNASGKPANGASGSPSISADGRFVAFQSDASDLVCSRRCPSSAEDINLVSDVFVFDRMTRTVAWVSTGRAGGWMEESGAPAVDGTGQVIAFTSRHPIDEQDTGHDFDLFVRIPSELR